MHSLKQISNTGRKNCAARASAWLRLLLRWWMLCCLGLAPLLANAGCFLDGNEWFCSAPDIYIQSPSNGQSILTGTPVTVVVNAYDYAPDGAQHTSLIYEIRLYVNGTYTQVQRYSPNAAEATAQFALGALAAGSYTLKATVMDQQGRERSAQVQITVAGPVLTATQTSVVASPNPVQVGRSTTLIATVAGGTPTGSVTFKQDGQVGTAVAMSGTQASFPMSFQNVGWYYVMATYSGDSNHQGSSTALLQIVVEKRQTAVALSASSATAMINGPVTFTAAVDGSSPSGTVTFKSGGADLQTVAVTNGAASLTTSFGSAGSRAITAVYNGDANNAASSSNAVGVGIISPASIGLVASTALPTVGQTVTYTASVTGASPTGTVQFYENGAPKGGAVAMSSGTATLSTSYETAGTRTISASYSGDSLNATASSAGLGVAVGQRGSTTGLTISNASPQIGGAITLTASVAGTNPTGSVTFLADGVALGGAVGLTNGSAVYTASFAHAGGRTLSVSYSGDANHTSSASGGQVVTVQKQTTSAGLSIDVASPKVAQSVRLTATLAGGAGVVPTGAVTFLSDGAAIASAVAVINGKATLDTSFSTVGSRALTATYSGDGDSAAATSAAVGLAVVKRDSSVALTTSASSVQPGRPVTVTAVVAGTQPTGSVTFYDGSQALGAAVTLSNGAASKAITFAALGARTVTARYSGDGNHEASVSGGVSIAVEVQTVAVTVPHIGNPIAGSLPGSLELSGGKATYSVPVVMPPGVNGMMPSVSLNYNGGAGNGIAGVGWSIGGRSSVHRCPPTIAQDGRGDAIRLSVKDRLCLDGKRLVLVGPGTTPPTTTNDLDTQYWASNATYRTEVETFVRVQRINNGFTVYTRDGKIHQYGVTSSSGEGAESLMVGAYYGVTNATYSWALRQTADRNGNTISYHYSLNQATGEQLLSSISWGAGPTQADFAKVVFEYEGRPDPETLFAVGARADVRQRLKTVTTWTDTDSTAPIKALEYRLSYGLSPSSGRSVLTSLQLCAPNEGCLPATTFQWGEPDPSKSRAYVSKGVWNGPVLEDRYMVGVNSAGHSQDNLFVTGDFDGDGRVDVMTRFGGSNITLYRSTATNFVTSKPLPGLASEMAIVEVGDFDGDGQADLLLGRANLDLFGALQVSNEILTEWKVCYSRLRQGGSFECVDWQVDGLNAIQRVVYDFNADGRDDLYFSGGSPGDGNRGVQRACISTGTGFTCQIVPAEDALFLGPGPNSLTTFAPLSTADLDGDGRLDFITAGQAVYNAEGNFWTFNEPYISGRGYSAGVGEALKSVYTLLHDYGIPPEYTVNTPANYLASATGVTGDVNGDGLTDFLFSYGPTPSSALTRKLCLMTGNGSPYCEERSEVIPRPDWYVGNIEGDGVPRVMTARPVGQYTGSPLGCLIRFGGSLECKTWTIPAQPAGNSPNPPEDWQKSRIFFLDVTGDGHPEVVYYQAGGHWEILEHTRLAKDGEALDRLVQITNGAGLPTRITYALPGDSNVYARDAIGPDGGTTAAVYPKRPVPLIDQAVSSVKVGNGQGGWLETRYRFAGALSDHSGYGFLGYARMDATDVASGITSTTWFSQSWPTIGMAVASRQISASGVVLVDSRTELDAQTLTHATGQTTRFPFNKTVTVVKKDLSGDAMGTSVTAAVYGDGWGNPTQVVETVSGDGETFLSTTNTTFENRSTDWLLGLAKRSEVTKVRAGVATTRTTSADYDVKGQPFQQTVEPDAVEYRVMTELSRNSFGSVTKAQQTWLDPLSGVTKQRTSLEVTETDAKGRFALKSKNALGHEESKQYDPRHGGVTRSVSVNGIATEWVLDAFGRALKETHPDGTETRQWAVQCDADCPAGAVQAAVTDLYQGGQRYGAPSIQYSDSVGHLLRRRTNGLQGQVVVSDQRFDARGRMVEVDRPRYADDPAVLQVRSTYDDLNRATSSTSLDEAGIERALTTTHRGLRVTLTNAKGYSAESYSDALGGLKRSVDANGKETTFERTPFGELTKTRDPVGNEVVATLDRLGRRTKLVDPDLGTTNYDVDPLGRVWRQTSAKNQVVVFEYDLLDRMVARHEPDLESRWVFDSAPKGIGQLAEAYTQNAAQTKDYRRQHTFDALGRPSATTINLDGVAVAATTAYDDKGRVATVSYQRNADAAKTFGYRYSSTGYLAGVDRGAAALWTAQLQDAAGRVLQALLGNGLTRLATYDSNSGRLTAASLERGVGNATLVEGYQYDALSNVTQRTQWWDGAGFVEAFDYDGLQRLKSSQVFGQPQQAFGYDDIGNMTSKPGVGIYSYPAAGQRLPHAVSSVTGMSGSYVYDENGNLSLAPNGTALAWTSFDMPSRIERGGAWSQFAYGPDHQRGRQTRSNGTTVLYLGAMEQETAADGAVTLKTYWPMGLGVETDKSGQATDLLWTHVDRLGSVIALTQADGQFREKLAYDAWGKRRTLDGAATPDSLDGQAGNRGFTGHEMLDNVDMVHMNGRIYDPYLARFISADPLIQDPEHSQSYNRYSYVWNNPTNMTDPTGFSGEKKDKTVVILPSPKEIANALCKPDDAACKEKAEADLRNLLGLPNGADLPAEGNVVLTYSSQARESTVAPEKTDGQRNGEKRGDSIGGRIGSWWEGVKERDRKEIQEYLDKGGSRADLETMPWDVLPQSAGPSLAKAFGKLFTKKATTEAAEVLAKDAVKSGVKIVERDGSVVIASFQVAKGEARVMAEMVRDGDRLILRGRTLKGMAL